MNRTVIVHPDAATLAATTAARLLVRLVDAQSTHRPVHVALTGGTVGIRTLSEIAASPVRHAVDWTGVHLWWGDERFLPDGDPDRNVTQARQALLDDLPVPEENIHPMGPSDAHDSPESAADDYQAELARHAESGVDDAGPALPAFDVVLLGVGPDGHVASLFPGHEACDVLDRTVVGVHGSPKPPPHRVSLTFAAIEAADEVWLVVGGEDKAPAVARALDPGDTDPLPAARVLGRHRTLWLVDAAAAG
ncbi:6-phosphogluconolactonase [Cellulomonas bogoriensis]|uniref:6-phosphogluconolactonase n=1 Tax=Cellulomonas bogoriensis 69B4 = DSM 16987 TaxID=1386082 RepID=A0A0A0C385_9CELL|nr:6-phosphogluconolactonase [Cellulomonas bogoriensis]KGM14492.1 6-phosphogluconolactonase [Cellulomonas bogoriensis 69B4 = DSM 16987]